MNYETMELLLLLILLVNVSSIVSLNETSATLANKRNALTFDWYDDVVAEKVAITAYDKNPHPAKHLSEHSQLYRESNGTLILQATNFTSEFSDAIAWTKSAGFVDTVFYSYQKHHNLVIRPDDIWTAIIVQFSLYVNGNAEELRQSLVNFKGKKELEVKFVAPVDQVPIDLFIEKIVTLIDDNIDPSIIHWITPNFTTTTQNDKLTAGVALMATLQKYFHYNLMTILCGIPEVTILGTVDDWKEIRKRVKMLKDFELPGKDVMAKWSTMLGRILDEFVSVKEGKQPDEAFWKQAIRVDYEMIDFGCGKVNETYLNGWITTFSAFDMSGRWQKETSNDGDILIFIKFEEWLRIRTDTITPGVVQVPIKIFDKYAKADEGEYTGTIITGHMGYAVLKDDITIQPVSGWTMAITNRPPEYLRNKTKST